mmetsp:Transcript_7213/g.18715  ORF Transcript_7213/g.18715 Transcript_7213/m.18715 type:complete len:274 (-) Transcript_7213:704-1525(-)
MRTHEAYRRGHLSRRTARHSRFVCTPSSPTASDPTHRLSLSCTTCTVPRARSCACSCVLTRRPVCRAHHGLPGYCGPPAPRPRPSPSSSRSTGMGIACRWSCACGSGEPIPTIIPPEQHTLANSRSQQIIGRSQSKLVSHACGADSPSVKPNGPFLGSSKRGCICARRAASLAASSARSRAARSIGVSPPVGPAPSDACGGGERRAAAGEGRCGPPAGGRGAVEAAAAAAWPVAIASGGVPSAAFSSERKKGRAGTGTGTSALGQAKPRLIAG